MWYQILTGLNSQIFFLFQKVFSMEINIILDICSFFNIIPIICNNSGIVLVSSYRGCLCQQLTSCTLYY